MKQELFFAVAIVILVIILITYRMMTKRNADIVSTDVATETALDSATKTAYVVFTEEQARTMNAQTGKDETLYTPSKAEIEKAEQLLRKEIPAFDTYYRQYYGTHRIVSDWKVINVRAFNKSKIHPEWEIELIRVLDGGKNYIDGTANLNTDMVLFRYHDES